SGEGTQLATSLCRVRLVRVLGDELLEVDALLRLGEGFLGPLLRFLLRARDGRPSTARSLVRDEQVRGLDLCLVRRGGRAGPGSRARRAGPAGRRFRVRRGLGRLHGGLRLGFCGAALLESDDAVQAAEAAHETEQDQAAEGRPRRPIREEISRALLVGGFGAGTTAVVRFVLVLVLLVFVFVFVFVAILVLVVVLVAVGCLLGCALRAGRSRNGVARLRGRRAAGGRRGFVPLGIELVRSGGGIRQGLLRLSFGHGSPDW